MKFYQYLFIISFTIILSPITNAQELKKVELTKQLTLVSFTDNSNTTLKAINGFPLISFEIDKKPATSNDAGIPVSITIKEITDFTPGYKAIVNFTNKSDKPINLRNVVPFGTEKKEAYIGNFGDHGLSRTYIFVPGRAPVNCIVPDNAWNLGFCAFNVSNRSICALTRRDNNSAVKTKISRFENTLEPGGSISYNLYADFYKGSWQEGLRLMFQERYLYDVERFDNTLFNREDLKWIRHSYVMHLIMAWDKYYFNADDQKFHLTDFIKRGQKLYGGDEVIGLWPTWPTLGVDQRNQFDMFRDLPGGMPQIKRMVDTLHKMGTKLFVAYNPWDESTRFEGHITGLADILKNTDADGAILDTRGESSKELQGGADKVKKGVIMYSEGMAVPKDQQGIVSGRVHNALYYPPLLNLNKFIKPEFAIFRVAEFFKEPIQREFATSFFNGYGTELNIFAPGHADNEKEQYLYLARTSRILRENTFNFTDNNYVPLIPTLADSIYVNKWSLKDKTIYTIFSLVPEGFNDHLFEVENTRNSHFVDIWNHEELSPDTIKGKIFIKADIAAFSKKYLGTNNEGEVDCIAQLPRLLDTRLYGDTIFIKAVKGGEIKVWAGNPAYDKTPVTVKPGNSNISLLKAFGRYEGKFVIQLMENGILLDENIHVIAPGTPRLSSFVEKTPRATGNEKDMVRIPAGAFTFKTTNGDEFIPYAKYNQGQTYQMLSFMMDQYPVTNAQFYQFIKNTQYNPKDKVNFLKHWKNGKPISEEMNFPVVNVSYEDAQAYARWAGKRLPTELEWQYAAQTSDGRDWPWSKDTKNIIREEEPVTQTLTVFKIKGINNLQANTGTGKLYSVGKYNQGVNPFGLYDLTGSVWQLTNDVYKSGSYIYIIMKGGSYYNPSSSWWYVQGGPRELHFRQFLLRVSQGFERNATVGFRCIRDL